MIIVVLSGIKLIRDVPYTGPRKVDVVGAILSAVGMGGIVLGILVWQEGGESVAALIVVGGISMGGLAYWLTRRKREGKATLLDPGLFKSAGYRHGISGQMLQQIALGGMMIALPIYLQMVLEYNAMQAGLSLAPLSLSMFAIALLASKRTGKRRPSSIIRAGFALVTVGLVILVPLVPRVDSGWYLVIPLVIAGSGLGLLVSQLNNYTLSPISEERVSEAAGVNSAAGSFGLSFGLAFAGAIMLATLSVAFTKMANNSTVLTSREQAAGLKDARARRRDHEQHGSAETDCRSTQGDPGRDHQHQHRLTTHRTSGRAADSDTRRPARPGQRVPDDASPRPETVERGRRHGAGLTAISTAFALERPEASPSRSRDSDAGR